MVRVDLDRDADGRHERRGAVRRPLRDPRGLAAGQDLWFPAPNELAGASELFHTPVYDRGAMTLQALREKVGEDTFFTILRTWYAENRYSNVTTQDFIALAERVSGQQLDQFFHVWLFEEGRPEPGSW